jgi:hypothetical protein
VNSGTHFIVQDLDGVGDVRGVQIHGREASERIECRVEVLHDERTLIADNAPSD